MKIIGYLICAISVLIIECIVLYPLTSWIAGPSLVNLLPFLVISCVPLFFIGCYVVGSENIIPVVLDSDDDYVISEKYEYERKRLSAEEKLKNKYVDGVVTDMGYTKKMARL